MTIKVYPETVYNQDYMLRVGLGKVSGASAISAYGRRLTAGAETNILWPDGTYALPASTGIQMSVVSTSANDTAAGTGTRTIEIHYLDANLADQSETVTLNGVTPVLTVATNIRFIQCMHVLTYGTGKAAAGTITAYVGAQNYAEISTGKLRCSSSVRMVPAGKKMIVNTIHAGSSSGAAGASTIIELVTCNFGGHDYTADSIFIPLGSATFQDNSGGINILCPLVFNAGDVFGFRFETDKAATITGFWSGWTENA